jgi:hypothetical protein
MNTALDTYSTQDIYTATVLSLFFPIYRFDFTDPHKILFIWKRDQGLDDVLESYYRKELKLEPQAVLHQYKDLRTRLYERNFPPR